MWRVFLVQARREHTVNDFFFCLLRFAGSMKVRWDSNLRCLPLISKISFTTWQLSESATLEDTTVSVVFGCVKIAINAANTESSGSVFACYFEGVCLFHTDTVSSMCCTTVTVCKHTKCIITDFFHGALWQTAGPLYLSKSTDVMWKSYLSDSQPSEWYWRKSLWY